ncbi:DUF4301 family protein [Wenyingzhuangia sp. 2_MG-2023]|uniref:DUF4301 family protein n=1 Tax=Wenyingzhuangia sp. 2_MG-2023 TaxID=3062639 RepID=UPI0026E4239A|nr:DUF4301 family protein [Wenyingzhuangia sp. 2_MG-2023]MDO6737312.1 DUF4301 family protein [Wenyingzhuangia sp. 2_MG-2023]MDO6801608.1 DUF4301 family protein [Wenyingzhuangia sp. 1_MG-2023]
MRLEQKLREEIDKRGITKEMLAHQMLAFVKGTPTIKLDRIATLGDGIIEINSYDRSKFMNIYNLKQQEVSIVKFTPASGLASRMFKGLSEFYNTKTNNPMSQYFFNNLHKFPFYKDVIIEFHKLYPSIKKLDNLTNKLLFLSFILSDVDNGLNYQKTPKGLIKFHQYDIDNKSALEEQIDEGFYYAICKNQTVNIHFTVSPDFVKKFQKKAQDYIKNNYSDSGVTFNISYSIQKPSTDTIALNYDNTPFKDENGNYLFRAGGHGALIENLNELDADVIFIKNIDNVSHQNHMEETIKYKQVLAGKLLFLQEKIFHYLTLLKSNSKNLDVQEVRYFIMENFFISFDDSCDTDCLIDFLNRPIRVCGMIKNQGDAGGGPFWISNTEGGVSLQIIESAQVDKTNKEQLGVMHQATHFNPVDIVCSVRDFEGNKFDLTKYVNHDAVFITDKTVNGIKVKGLELPGLWNGAMHDWLSVFVEVPIETFNPVKTVTDLLSPMHQA